MKYPSLLHNSKPNFPHEGRGIWEAKTIRDAVEIVRQYQPSDPMLEAPLFTLAYRERQAVINEIWELLEKHSQTQALELIKEEIEWHPDGWKHGELASTGE